MAHPAGESKDSVLKLDFDCRLMLQFRGSVVADTRGPAKGSTTASTALVQHEIDTLLI